MAILTLTIPPCEGCCDPCLVYDGVESFSLTITPPTSCGCVNLGEASENGSVIFTDISYNGTFALNYDAVNDWWTAELGTATHETHNLWDCEDFIADQVSYISAFLVCTNIEGSSGLYLSIVGCYDTYPASPLVCSDLSGPTYYGGQQVFTELDTEYPLGFPVCGAEFSFWIDGGSYTLSLP